jgi:perosamine synthetase
MPTKREVSISKPFMGPEEVLAVQRPLASGWLTQGPCVAEFEKEFAKIHSVEHAFATTSCTTALHLALVALGIGPGDEVIIPSFTWIATANVVEYVGATPVFCDITKDTYNIDIDKVEQLITPRTRVVIAVHLFGLCADIEPLKKICSPKKIYIVEDAACAAGASYYGKMAGSLGDIGCFSFHPRKIITTGEGGMCTTNDPDLAKKIGCLRNHGASLSEEQRHHGAQPYQLPEFNILGFNYRMTDIQGAIGLAQLARLHALVTERRSWAKWYRKELSSLNWLTVTAIPEQYEHSYQAFVCSIDKTRSPKTRDQILEYLHKAGVGGRPGTHAIHMLNYYANKYHLKPDDFPQSRDCNNDTLAIPLHNKMQPEDYEYVVELLKGLK